MNTSIAAIVKATSTLVEALEAESPYQHVFTKARALQELLSPGHHLNELHPLLFRDHDIAVRRVLQSIVALVFDVHNLHLKPDSIEKLKQAVAYLSPKQSEHDERDKFIYTSMENGKHLKWIMNQIKANLTWEEIVSEQGVSLAAKRYAARKQLQWPIQRVQR